jgi:hypothetical protein
MTFEEMYFGKEKKKPRFLGALVVNNLRFNG